MLKSGLIIGGVMLVLAIGASLLSPICVPCLALFAGLGAGYLAGMFDKPSLQNIGVRSGASAGAIGGVGALIGQLIGGGINAVVVGPEGAQQFMQQIAPDLATGSTNSAAYYFGVFGSACCIGLFNVAIMAGLGALGGLLWWNMTGKNQGGMSAPPPSFSQ